jgi:hypothetical protein
MGANATTFVPKYTSGEVLTAANLSVTNSGIPVFATTTTRDNSFGGTGEKVLAEGQFAYIEATDTTQYYDGSAWLTVGAGGVAYITQATPTAVNTVSINNCFTSTYANYFIVIDTTAAVGNGVLTARLRASGTDSTTNYTSQRMGGQGTVVFASTNASGTDDFYFAGSEAATASTYGFQTTLLSPALARGTVGLGFTGYQNSGGSVVEFIWNNHTTATAYDGITVNYSGTSFTGTIRVYGYQNS